MTLVIGIVVGVAIWRMPQFRDGIEPLLWLVPISAFLFWFAYRLTRAPFELYQEILARLSISEQQRVIAEEALRDKRDFRKIADYLTERHSYGTHQLLHIRPTSAGTDVSEWNRWVKNWFEEIMSRLREYGCTPQELNSIETIAVNDLPLATGAPLEVARKMLYVRLQRIDALAALYAKRAAEMKSAV